MNKLTSEIYARIDREDGYPVFRNQIASRIAALRAPLFTTDADPKELGRLFVEGLPYGQHTYKCHACLDFIKRYGGLVQMDERGNTAPALWVGLNPPNYFEKSVSALFDHVAKARVTGVFVSSKSVWGTPETPPWTHLYGEPLRVFGNGDGRQYAEDFKMVARVVHETRLPEISRAIAALESGHLARGSNFIRQAKWLQALIEASQRAGSARQERNLIWKAVATAPAGWCHVNSSVLGSLLEDIRAGYTFEEIKRRFNAKLDPLRYQRPTTVRSGNIEQAEQLVQKLGLEKSLARRFARLGDVECFWDGQRPTPAPFDELVRVFGSVKPTRSKSVQRRLEIPPCTMTWVKFRAEVLDRAETLEYAVPNEMRPYAALVAPVYPEAPSLFKWENGVSWYLYYGGSLPSAWNLRSDWVPVVGIAEHPRCWGLAVDELPRHNDRYFFILEGCYDVKYRQGGAFFPEQIRSALHGVRQTLEAYARTAVIEAQGPDTVAGLMAEKDRAWDLTLRVNGEDRYLIDRWD